MSSKEGFHDSLKFNKVYTSYLIIVIAFVMIMTLLTGCGGRNEYRMINVSEIFGNVSVVEDNKEYVAYKGMRVREGQTIVTSGSSYTRMVLDDDKYIKLEEGSKAIVNTLANGRTEIILERGSITNEIVKPLYEGQSYIIHTPNATLAVRGTFFRVDLSSAENGDLKTEVLTYGGSVVSQRKLPSGEMVEEAVAIDAGYKATINMDDTDTVYVEEVVDEKLEYLIPIEPENLPDEDLVDIYFAAQNGHEMFVPTETLLSTIEDRNIDISTYVSAYQQAEGLGLTGNATAPDDNFYRVEESEGAEGKTEHHAPYDGTLDSKKNPLKEVLEEIVSIFVPQEEDVTQETEIEIDETIESEVVTNIEISEEERTEEIETVPDIEQVPEEEKDKIESVKPSENVGGGSGNIGDSGGGTNSGSGGENNNPPACNHSITTERTEPTCTQDGQEVEKCTICGEVLSSNIILATGHRERTRRTEPMCTREGQEVRECTVCNEVLDSTIIPATGHAEDTMIIREATCTDKGEKLIKCTVCGEEIRTEEVLELGHNMEVKETIAATCQSGTKVTRECSRCHEEETTTGTDKVQHLPKIAGVVKTTCSYCNAAMIQYNNEYNTFEFFDEGLRNELVNYDTELPSNYLMDEELNYLKNFSINSRQDMVSMQGIEYLTVVEELNVVACTSLNNISLNGSLLNLKKIMVSGNALVSLNVSGSPNLTEVTISNEQALTSIDVNNCPSLKNVKINSGTPLYGNSFNTMSCSGLEITYSGSMNSQLDLSTMTDKNTIKSINIDNSSNLASVNVSGLTGLEELSATVGCYGLENIDASGCTGLTSLNLMDSSGLKTLNVSDTALTSLGNLNTQQSLITLDISGCTGLTSLDVRGCIALQEIKITGSGVTADNITGFSGTIVNS